MGNSSSTGAFAAAPDSDEEEDVFNFLDRNPTSLWNFLDRNPDRVDRFNNRDDEENEAGAGEQEILKIQKVDYLKDKNAKTHNTSKYEHKSLIVRRASKFNLDLYFKNRAYNPECDKVLLEFSIGAKADVATGTKFRCPMFKTNDVGGWSCVFDSEDLNAKKISVDVNIPSDAIIGRYKLTVEITSELEDGKKTERTTKPDIIVIFNPFSKDDSCFMENTLSRHEYVMKATGTIYVGNSNQISARTWLFGQFEEGVLDAVLQMLRDNARAKKEPQKARRKSSSPIYCSRVLAAMVNSNDDRGVLVGNWSGNYSGGKAPTFWSSSVAILKQWMQTKAPVKYGQCWVFSGLLTTALRALGIPGRSVTNFRSAHDTDGNSTIDKFLDASGEVSRRSNDSIWNFHVWNEAWFKRPDLPEGYDGWQVVDATPQEESSGLMQCGPAPVKAVKNGEIYIGSDTGFIFSEVNADLVHWMVNDAGEVTKLIRRNRRYVGRHISTKAEMSSTRQDLTSSYKFPEGSKEERMAFERAFAHGRKTDFRDKLQVIEDEGVFTIDIKALGNAVNGKDLIFAVKVSNRSGFTRDVTITTVMNAILNNGESKNLVKRVRLKKKIEKNESCDQNITVKFDEYGARLVDENVIRVTTTARVKETDNLYLDTFHVNVRSPPGCLMIQCNDVLKFNRNNKISFRITNPLPVSLTFGQILLEGLGVTDGTVLTLRDPIEPGESFKTKEVIVRPKRRGQTALYADFDAQEINNIRASKSVTIK